jgi:hypothetical protein
MPDPNTASIVNTAIGALPGIIALIKSAHSTNNPDAPVLTDEQVLDALNQAVASSVAKDEQWLAQHPPAEKSPDIGGDVPGGGAV